MHVKAGMDRYGGIFSWNRVICFIASQTMCKMSGRVYVFWYVVKCFELEQKQNIRNCRTGVLCYVVYKKYICYPKHVDCIMKELKVAMKH